MRLLRRARSAKSSFAADFSHRDIGTIRSLTAKVFQTDPLDSAIRIYRTGDLGRWRSDGMLEHVGRKGRRIRLRGYNVEPFQVECELMRQPGVTDAVVFLHDGAAGPRAMFGGLRRCTSECLGVRHAQGVS